ncbi:MAG: ribosome silencing factor [Bacteroidetes bacterium]|nr:ribosome silencing factor [Bacteroidota bacterium]
MAKNTKVDSGRLLADVIVKGMEEKKGKGITLIDLREVKGAVADYFVICEGDSDRQVQAIAKSVEEFVDKEIHEDPYHREGYENSEWILLDYVNVVAHVFIPEKREFFALEDLWGDGEITRY